MKLGPFLTVAVSTVKWWPSGLRSPHPSAGIRSPLSHGCPILLRFLVKTWLAVWAWQPTTVILALRKLNKRVDVILSPSWAK